VDRPTEATTLSPRLAEVRTACARINAQTERVLWMLDRADTRLNTLTAQVRAKRDASDRLRLRLIESRLTIARLRQLVRLLIRLGELRRVVL
jgi:hypothetical protein